MGVECEQLKLLLIINPQIPYQFVLRQLAVYPNFEGD